MAGPGDLILSVKRALLGKELNDAYDEIARLKQTVRRVRARIARREALVKARGDAIDELEDQLATYIHATVKARATLREALGVEPGEEY